MPPTAPPPARETDQASRRGSQPGNRRLRHLHRSRARAVRVLVLPMLMLVRVLMALLVHRLVNPLAGLELRIGCGHLELIGGKDVMHWLRRLVHFSIGSANRKLVGRKNVDGFV